MQAYPQPEHVQQCLRVHHPEKVQGKAEESVQCKRIRNRSMCNSVYGCTIRKKSKAKRKNPSNASVSATGACATVSTGAPSGKSPRQSGRIRPMQAYPQPEHVQQCLRVHHPEKVQGKAE